jgi:hypothetical protein
MQEEIKQNPIAERRTTRKQQQLKKMEEALKLDGEIPPNQNTNVKYGDIYLIP